MQPITINATYDEYINCSIIRTINDIPAELVDEDNEKYRQDDSNTDIYIAISETGTKYMVFYYCEYPHASIIHVKMADGERWNKCSLHDPDVTFILEYTP
jgi:hypothetical protein